MALIKNSTGIGISSCQANNTSFLSNNFRKSERKKKKQTNRQSKTKQKHNSKAKGLEFKDGDDIFLKFNSKL